jgi:hypothetical protein
MSSITAVRRERPSSRDGRLETSIQEGECLLSLSGCQELPVGYRLKPAVVPHGELFP